MVYYYHARVFDELKQFEVLTATATPFKDGKRAVACKSTEPDRCEEDSSEEEDNVADTPGSLRFTTRANIPYNIEGYEKNAMLMMHTTAEYNSTYENDDLRDKMARVTTVFTGLRFEIESFEDLTDDQIDQKCQDFFQRDFTDYGCVAVVLFKPDGCKIEDAVIMRHWTTDGNPTLRGKPKLYINESSHYHAYRRPICLPYYSVPITDDHPDVLCLHVPSLLASHFPQPLRILCDKLATMPHDHVLAIIKETIEDSKPTLRPLTMVYFCHTCIPDYFIKPAAEVAANPFKDEKKSVASTSTQSDISDEEEERTDEEDDAVENAGALRITTRANIPYNLEGYARNAMLIMQDNTDSDLFKQDERNRKMSKVAETFAKLRFEIIQFKDLTPEQIAEKSQEFFLRDFTDYGCVAVVVLKTIDVFFDDSVIVRHCTTNGNPTLQGKPKLYISETSYYQYHEVSGIRNRLPNYSMPIIDDHPDVLCVHMPAMIKLQYATELYDKSPLSIMCNKLTAMNNNHFMEIMEESINISKPYFKIPSYVASTLESNLFLPRSNETEHT